MATATQHFVHVRRDAWPGLTTLKKCFFGKRRRPKRADLSFVSVQGAAITSPTGPADKEAPTLKAVATTEDEDDAWDPASIMVALNAMLGDRAVCVLDGLCSERHRAEILEFLHGGGSHSPTVSVPDAAVWERSTSDSAGVAPTFGLRQELLRTLETQPPRAVRQIHARLCRLYPEYEIMHMPAFSEDEGGGGGTRTSFVANAAMQGDCFRWHLDADPQDLPSPSSAETARWRARHGDYTNG